MRALRVIVWACAGTLLWCNPLPLDSDGGTDAASDDASVDAADATVEASPDAGTDDVTVVADAAPDVLLFTANEWVLPIDMNGNRQAVAADSAGNVVIAGETTSTSAMFFAKLDPHGNVIWSKSFAGGQDGTGLAIDSSDDILLVGTSGSSTFDVGGSTLGVGSFVAKFAPDGSHVWSKPLAPTDDYAPRVAISDNDGLVVTGRLNGTAAIAGGQSVSATYGVYVVKIASGGSVAWTYTFGGNNDTPRTVASDGAGGVVFVGEGALCGANGSNYVAHVDGAGACTAVVLGDYLTFPLGVAVDPSGNVFTTMQNDPGSSFCSGDFAFTVAKLDPSLGLIWRKCVKGGVYPQAFGTAVFSDDAGNVTLTGALTAAPDASIDLGGGPITTSGPFVARFAPDGGFISNTLWPTPIYILPLEMTRAPAQDVYLLGNANGTLSLGDASVAIDAGGFLARQTP